MDHTLVELVMGVRPTVKHDVFLVVRLRLTQGGVDNVTLLLGELAGGGGGEVVRPVIPAYQRRQADDTADQPHQQDHQVHPALRPLGGVVDRVVNGPIPEYQQVE